LLTEEKAFGSRRCAAPHPLTPDPFPPGGGRGKRCILSTLIVLASFPAQAHQTSVSFSELEIHGAEVGGTLRFALQDLRALAVIDPRNPDIRQVAPLLLEPFVLKASGEPCPLQPGPAVHPDGEDGIALTAKWRCPKEIEELTVRVGFLDSLPLGHAHLSRIQFASDEISQRVAQAEEPSFDVHRSHTVRSEFWRFLKLGIEHIFAGYDHIAFLIGLLLLGGSVKRLVGIVTAFTVAHSITLALAALNILAPSPKVIEPLIAASILFVGLEDLWALRKKQSDAALRHRWMITFGFGLVHGFGFASVLRELDLPRAVLATGLLSFNLGVECGQIVIVLLALPLLRQLDRHKKFAPGAAMVVAALGAFWLVQRILTPG
jgi:hydrogenase/urease accessory protein HupE